MDAVKINAKDYVGDTRAVIDSAAEIATVAARHLRAGTRVLLSVHGVRGVSSSFFNVVLSGVSEALSGELPNPLFEIETETATQQTVLDRSLAAFGKHASSNGA